MKKCSMFNSLVTRELQIKRETATQLLEWLKLKTKQNFSIQEEQGCGTTRVGGSVNWYNHLENSLVCSKDEDEAVL